MERASYLQRSYVPLDGHQRSACRICFILLNLLTIKEKTRLGYPRLSSFSVRNTGGYSEQG